MIGLLHVVNRSTLTPDRQRRLCFPLSLSRKKYFPQQIPQFFSLSCTSPPPRWISLFCNQTSAWFAVCNLRGYTELWPSAESSTEADSCQRILTIVRNIGHWLKQTALFQCFIWVCLYVCNLGGVENNKNIRNPMGYCSLMVYVV